MMIISSRELGIRNCDLVISGDRAGDIVARMVDHLRSEHDMDLPDADVIMRGKISEKPLAEADPGAVLAAKRMIDVLEIVPPEETVEMKEIEQPQSSRVEAAV